jgi:hypothetical protein
MTVAEDVAGWVWPTGRFEEVLRDRPAGHFVAAWPEGKSPAILLSWVLGQLLAYVVAHQGVWIATANKVASLA